MATMTDRFTPHLLLVGPSHHGVVRYGRDLAHALRESGRTVRVVSVRDGQSAVSIAAGLERVHMHVTDRVFGSNLEEAAVRVEQIGDATDLSITLHDLPQPSDGTNFSRRQQTYRRFLDSASGVAVNSHYEAELISTFLLRSVTDVRVIPIGARSVAMAGSAAAGPSQATSLAAPPLRVLIGGYIYPGKGHWEAISAVGSLAARLKSVGSRPPEATVVAIGAPSAGHEGDIDALHRHADELGVTFRVTGFLDDDLYRREMSSFGIPVAAHQHVSASRSMVDWVELRRNALVVDSPYAREMSKIRPGTMTLYEPDLLADYLEAAWRNPSSTHLAADASIVPTLHDTAREYSAWWAALAL